VEVFAEKGFVVFLLMLSAMAGFHAPGHPSFRHPLYARAGRMSLFFLLLDESLFPSDPTRAFQVCGSSVCPLSPIFFRAKIGVMSFYFLDAPCEVGAEHPKKGLELIRRETPFSHGIFRDECPAPSFRFVANRGFRSGTASPLAALFGGVLETPPPGVVALVIRAPGISF